MEFDPIRAQSAATGLDALADRLEHDLRDNAPALTVQPAGAEEVSVRAAETLNTVASNWEQTAVDGIHELRKLAAVVRSQSQLLDQMESENAAGFRAAG